MTLEEKLRKLEEELAKTPVNKGTEVARAKLKARIAQLREKIEQKRAGTGASTARYAVKKHGDATIVLVGYPSAGKSTLLNRITNAESRVGEYEFTTLEVVPGVMEYNHARIQVLDIPGIIGGAAHGKGRGREILSVVRIGDLIVAVLDPSRGPGQYQEIVEELHQAGIRPNQEPPRIEVKKTDRGGVIVNTTVKLSHLEKDTIASVAREYGIVNGIVTIHEDVDSIDRLVDAFARNRVYIPMIVAINKTDAFPEETIREIEEACGDARVIRISALKGEGLEELKRAVWEELGLIRVWTRPKGKPADKQKDEPIILKKGATIRDACERIHKDFVEKFRYARVWGSSAKFPGQRHHLDHELQDGDEIEIVVW